MSVVETHVFDEIVVWVDDGLIRVIEVETEKQQTVEVEASPAKPQVHIETGLRGIQGPKGERGERGPAGHEGATGGYYAHKQLLPDITWVIDHSLEMRPSVTILDSAGSLSFAEIDYVSDNRIVLTFSAAVAGVAYLS